jgi:hypothetical protein
MVIAINAVESVRALFDERAAPAAAVHSLRRSPNAVIAATTDNLSGESLRWGVDRKQRGARFGQIVV